MSEETTAVDGALVAPVDNAAAPAQPVEQAQNAPESTTEAQGETQLERDERGRFKSGAQERINEITRARREAERRADALEQRLAELERGRHTQPQASEPPTLEQYGYDNAEFSRALTAYAVEQATKAVESKYQQQESQRTQQEIFQSFEKRERDYAAKHPDYAETVSDLGRAVRFAPAVVETIGSMDAGPAVLHHLATHLDEADRIARMPAHIAALHLGRLERDLSAPKPKPVSNAPAPAPTVGGAAVIKKDPDAMTTDEWMRWRRDQLRAK